MDGVALLPTKPWLLTTFKMGIEYKALLNTVRIEINALDSARDCELEDIVEFYADSTYDILDKGLLCEETPESQIRESGFWFFSSDQKQFTVDLLKNQSYLKDLEELNIDSTTFNVIRIDPDAIGLELRLNAQLSEAPITLPDDYEIVISLELTPGAD